MSDQRRAPRQMRFTLVAGVLAVLAVLLLVAWTVASSATIALAAPLTPQTPLRATQPTDALPVRDDPAADAILATPPAQVTMWFSEDLNSLTSKMVVVDTTNHEVDLGDSHVAAENAREMLVSLPLLPAGTYIVVWRTQSADDGHITSGSYLFRIARPDGSVPPVPAVLPTPHITGGQALATGTLDGPTIVQAIMTWLALLLMVFWVGGVIWETWILAPRLQTDPDLHAAALAAVARFQRLAPYALGLLIAADVGIILAEAAELAGEWSGAFSLPLLHAIIFGSRFGLFWWLRQLAAIAALAATLLTRPQMTAAPAASAAAVALAATSSGAPPTADVAGAIPDWRRELLKTLRGIPQLPRHLWQGLRARSGEGIVLLVLGGALIAAFALSGHAAAVSASELGFALSVDIFHLIATTAWLGGLLYIVVVLLPSLRRLTPRQRARVLALGLPQFGALALVCAFLLAATGSLSATIHLTSLAQFFTTTYGRTLVVKIELFLQMAVISAYHAFSLRPRFALALTEDAERGEGVPPATPADPPPGQHVPTPERRRGPAVHARVRQAPREGAAVGGQNALALAGTSTASGALPARAPTANTLNAMRPASIGAPRSEQLATSATSSAPADDAQTRHPENLATPTQRLAHAIEEWLGREAALGVGVLLCVALLGAFAGSLYSLPPAPTSHATGAFAQTQSAGPYRVTLNVSPDSFGTNTFTVIVTNAQKQPITGAAIQLQEGDLDMDMGIQTIQLKAVGASSPGVYTGQSDILMAGHWSITVKVSPPKSNQFHTATFKLTVSY